MNAVSIYSTILLLSQAHVEGYLRRSQTRPSVARSDLARDDLALPLDSLRGWSGRSQRKSRLTLTPTCPLPSPIDCQWSLWSTWSPCSRTSGGNGGTTSRSREISNIAYFGGMDCQGDPSENKACCGEDPCTGISNMFLFFI